MENVGTVNASENEVVLSSFQVIWVFSLCYDRGVGLLKCEEYSNRLSHISGCEGQTDEPAQGMNRVKLNLRKANVDEI